MVWGIHIGQWGQRVCFMMSGPSGGRTGTAGVIQTVGGRIIWKWPHSRAWCLGWGARETRLSWTVGWSGRMASAGAWAVCGVASGFQERV